MRDPIVVMGVSGSGKSTVGAAVAARMQLPFVDGDDLQPAVNKRKMASGVPLDDRERAPWLDAVAEVLTRGAVVVACSALRRRYRDRLRQAAPGLRLVYLSGRPAVLAQRLSKRSHEFMPASLLESQLATLEVPDADERALTVDIESSLEEVVTLVVAAFSA